MKKEAPSIIIGLLLVLGSILSSIIFKYPFWYSFYVIGAFILFGGLNYKLKSKSVYSYLLNNKWKSFLIIYFFGVLLGLSVDIIYGRNIADLWNYPKLAGISNILVPILLYYPFGALQVYEIFYFCKKILSRRFKAGKAYDLPNNLKDLIINLLIFFLILGLIFPILNLIFNLNSFNNEIIIILMVLTTFSFDAIVYKIKKESIFLDFIQGNKLIICTMILSWFIATILSEIPNIFSWEWIYHNIPFINFEIFKINIIIFTFGWFFLVYAPVRLIDLVKLLFKIEK